jgi:peptidoglycan/LPS O-acetylase OafA/YrhL
MISLGNVMKNWAYRFFGGNKNYTGVQNLGESALRETAWKIEDFGEQSELLGFWTFSIEESLYCLFTFLRALFL